MDVYPFDRRPFWYLAQRVGSGKDMSDIEHAIPGCNLTLNQIHVTATFGQRHEGVSAEKSRM